MMRSLSEMRVLSHPDFFRIREWQWSSIHGKFFPTILAGGGKRIYFFFEDFSSWWINLHLFTHSQFSGRYFPSGPSFMTALCFAPHTRHSISPVDSSTSVITFSFFVILPMSIFKGDKIMEWGVWSDHTNVMPVPERVSFQVKERYKLRPDRTQVSSNTAHKSLQENKKNTSYQTGVEKNAIQRKQNRTERPCRICRRVPGTNTL